MVLSPFQAPLLTSIPVLLSLLVAFQSTNGFSPKIRQLLPINHASSCSRCCFALNERKTRRRRKISEEGDEATGGRNNELPDFDLDEDGDNATAKDSAPAKKKIAKAASGIPADSFGQISANMMGSPGGPTKSFQDLLNDRSLESKLPFDDTTEEAESLPDLVAMARQQREIERQTGLPAPAPTITKRARQEARRSEALAAKEEEERMESLLAKLPLIRDEKGEISPIKILENGTWACIGMLVLWEFYINSPFFDRAAPMAPVVYEFFL